MRQDIHLGLKSDKDGSGDGSGGIFGASRQFWIYSPSCEQRETILSAYVLLKGKVARLCWYLQLLLSLPSKATGNVSGAYCFLSSKASITLETLDHARQSASPAHFFPLLSGRLP